MLRPLMFLTLAALAGYGLLEAWPLIQGPALTLSAPEDYGSFPGGVVPIEGVASRISMLQVNGAPLLHDREGRFSTTLTFPQGGSILTFVATDRFGRRIHTTRSIYVPD